MKIHPRNPRRYEIPRSWKRLDPVLASGTSDIESLLPTGKRRIGATVR